jgi:hypothetical protein
MEIKAETNDLIIAEKLSTFAIFGTANERIKDLYDAYWLLRNTPYSASGVKAYLSAITVQKRKLYSHVRLALKKIEETLSNPVYLRSFSKQANWTGEAVEAIADFIIRLLKSWHS